MVASVSQVQRQTTGMDDQKARSVTVLLVDGSGSVGLAPAPTEPGATRGDGMALDAAPKLSTDLREPTSPRCEQETPALIALTRIDTRRGGGAGSQAGDFADPAG